METLDGLGLEIMGADEEWKCPLPHDEKKFEPKAEDLVPKFDDDKFVPETLDLSAHDTYNSSEALGKALNRTKDTIDKYKAVRVTIEGDTQEERKVTVAAHHLIPGNGSLNPSALMVYISMKPGKKRAQVIAQNIGYDVNGANNGMWLPGWYAIEGWGAMKATPEGRLFRSRYVLAVIDPKKLDRQFHDSHEPYNAFVLNILDNLHQKMKTTGMYFCEECKKATESEGLKPPPYSLVKRLDGISERLKGKLEGPRSKWKGKIFTSSTWTELQKTGKIAAS